MADNIVEKVRELVDRYSGKLAEKGIDCNVSKKYFENDVEPYYYGRQGILNLIDEMISRIKERRYKNQRNTYHCIVLRFSPIKKGILEKKSCKEYSFVLHKKERAHIGDKPELTETDDIKLLSKVEKRLKKAVKRTENQSAEKLCKNNIYDILRYTFSVKYIYMKKVSGIEKSTVDIIVSCIIMATVFLILFICWIANRF